MGKLDARQMLAPTARLFRTVAETGRHVALNLSALMTLDRALVLGFSFLHAQDLFALVAPMVQ